jgi:hypothetical protein
MDYLIIRKRFRAALLRRTLAAVCALAFLLVTFAHTFHHAALAGTLTSQIEVSASDDSPDGPNKVTGFVEHCHGCTTVGTMSDPLLELAAYIVAIDPTTGVNGFSPYSRPADIPPPRPTT